MAFSLKMVELFVAKELISISKKETGQVAKWLLNRVWVNQTPTKKPIVFLLKGELGSGKTVFAKAVGKCLGIKEPITSPTFVICNEYDIKSKIKDQRSKKFLHMDLYRIKNEFEYKEIKFLEQFEKGIVACIEWPENMDKKLLTELKKKCRTIEVSFEYVDKKTRKINYNL